VVLYDESILIGVRGRGSSETRPRSRRRTGRWLRRIRRKEDLGVVFLGAVRFGARWHGTSKGNEGKMS
jgi:hypothetical protein